MSFDRQCLEFSFMFSVHTTDEIAITTLKLASITGWTGAVAAKHELEPAFGGNYLDAMSTLMLITQLQWADYSILKAVKLAAVGTDGHYLDAPLVYEAPAAVQGVAAGTIPQSTVVASLRSGDRFGAGNYGRMYLPHTRLGMVAGTPQCDAGTTATIAAAFKTFVNAVTSQANGDATATLFPMIMSSKAGFISKAVTSVAIGTVTDTQRRRRNRLKETYAFATLA